MASATLTVAQAQSNIFVTAFAAGIQNAIPGVTITVTSVTAARRRLLASVSVSYSASSTTASTTALSASLSSAATLAAVSTALGSAGYANVVTGSPVFTTSPNGIVASSASASASASDTTGGAIAGGIIGGLVVLAAVVGGTLFHLVHVAKTHEWRGCKLRKVDKTVQPMSQPYGEESTENNPQWSFFDSASNNNSTSQRQQEVEIETNPQWESLSDAIPPPATAATDRRREVDPGSPSKWAFFNPMTDLPGPQAIYRPREEVEVETNPQWASMSNYIPTMRLPATLRSSNKEQTG